MIDELSLAGIIKGCMNSGDFKSPECRLLKRIANGDDVPEYPEYNQEKAYYVQVGDKVLGPTDPFMYETMDELVEDYLNTYKDYPYDVWEAEE